MFSILTPEQTKHIRPVTHISVRHFFHKNHDDAFYYIKTLRKTSKTDEVSETYWFATPQNPGKEGEHTPIQTRKELQELENLELLNPQNNINSQSQILSNFPWTEFNLELEARQVVETLFDELHDFFARHRPHIGINTDFKVQLTLCKRQARL